MKCLGLVGSLNVTVFDSYWHTIRSETQKTLGADHMPRFLMHGVHPRHLQECLDRGDWKTITQILVESGRSVANAGANCIVVCGSALNPCARELHQILGQPVIDLGYSIRTKLRKQQYRNVAVLGIRTTKEEAMWREALDDFTMTQPYAAERAWLAQCMDDVIIGQPVTVEWKVETNRIISSLRRGGAEGLILAEPTLNQWIKPGESLLYPIDATEVHAWVATLWAMESNFLPAPGCVIVSG
jgi:aspartate racemase